MSIHFHFATKLAGLALAAASAMAVLAPAAQATPYVLTFTQQGNNVVASGSGAFNLSGLTSAHTQVCAPALVLSGTASVQTGQCEFGEAGFYGLQGPTSFGNSFSVSFADSSSGESVGIIGQGHTQGFSHSKLLFLPGGYNSGNQLTSNAIWNDESFSDFGINEGIYKWTWGSGLEQSFTIKIGNVAVPAPDALGLFGLGLVLLGGLVALRRRKAGDL